MKALPEGLEIDALIEPLAAAWGLEAVSIEYAPVGFGSYHWQVTDARGSKAFATVDDLDAKPWLGDNRDDAFEGLGRAYRTAVALHEAGLGFVVAPIPTHDGAALTRIASRYSLGLFPFVEGSAADYGEYETADERLTIIALLAQLHQATPAARNLALPMSLDLPGRSNLEAALREVDTPWSGGPLSELAREAIRAHAADLEDLLGLFDRLAAEVARRSGAAVVTHGEPHAANVITSETGLVLIDWDTVALAAPERDLWMVVTPEGEEAAAYCDATGREPDPVAIDFYRLEWDLKDLAGYVGVLRQAHRENDDTQKAYRGLVKCVAIRDEWVAHMLESAG